MQSSSSQPSNFDQFLSYLSVLGIKASDFPKEINLITYLKDEKNEKTLYEQVRVAHRIKAFKYHPDKNTEKSSEEIANLSKLFVGVHDANSFIKDYLLSLKSVSNLESEKHQTLTPIPTFRGATKPVLNEMFRRSYSFRKKDETGRFSPGHNKMAYVLEKLLPFVLINILIEYLGFESNDKDDQFIVKPVFSIYRGDSLFQFAGDSKALSAMCEKVMGNYSKCSGCLLDYIRISVAQEAFDAITKGQRTMTLEPKMAKMLPCDTVISPHRLLYTMFTTKFFTGFQSGKEATMTFAESFQLTTGSTQEAYNDAAELYLNAVAFVKSKNILFNITGGKNKPNSIAAALYRHVNRLGKGDEIKNLSNHSYPHRMFKTLEIIIKDLEVKNVQAIAQDKKTDMLMSKGSSSEKLILGSSSNFDDINIEFNDFSGFYVSLNVLVCRAIANICNNEKLLDILANSIEKRPPYEFFDMRSKEKLQYATTVDALMRHMISMEITESNRKTLLEDYVNSLPNTFKHDVAVKAKLKRVLTTLPSNEILFDKPEELVPSLEEFVPSLLMME